MIKAAIFAENVTSTVGDDISGCSRAAGSRKTPFQSLVPPTHQEISYRSGKDIQKSPQRLAFVVFDGPTGDEQEGEKSHCDDCHHYQQENEECLQGGEGTLCHFS